ncbi:MAG: WG repeat-containing protein [Oscillospiraceae bacterium]
MGKTVINIILVLGLVLTLTGCGKDLTKDTQSAISENQSSNISSSAAISSEVPAESAIPEKNPALAKTIGELEPWFWLGPIPGMLGTQAGNFDYLQYAVITVGEKKGIVNFNGNIILPIMHDKIELCFEGIAVDEEIYSDDLKTHEPHGGHGLDYGTYYWDIVSNKGYYASMGLAEFEDLEYKPTVPTLVQSCKIKKEENPTYGEYLFESHIGKYGYQNNGKLITKLEFDSAHEFSNELAAAKKDGLWGYIDETGKVAIEFQFDDIFEANIKNNQLIFDEYTPYNFHNGYAAVCKGDNWGYIDKNGKEITRFDYNWALPVYKNKAWVYNSEKEWHVINVK